MNFKRILSATRITRWYVKIVIIIKNNNRCRAVRKTIHRKSVAQSGVYFHRKQKNGAENLIEDSPGASIRKNSVYQLANQRKKKNKQENNRMKWAHKRRSCMCLSAINLIAANTFMNWNWSAVKRVAIPYTNLYLHSRYRLFIFDWIITKPLRMSTTTEKGSRKIPVIICYTQNNRNLHTQQSSSHWFTIRVRTYVYDVCCEQNTLMVQAFYFVRALIRWRAKLTRDSV